MIYFFGTIVRKEKVLRQKELFLLQLRKMRHISTKGAVGPLPQVRKKSKLLETWRVTKRARHPVLALSGVLVFNSACIDNGYKTKGFKPSSIKKV